MPTSSDYFSSSPVPSLRSNIFSKAEKTFMASPVLLPLYSNLIAVSGHEMMPAQKMMLSAQKKFMSAGKFVMPAEKYFVSAGRFAASARKYLASAGRFTASAKKYFASAAGFDVSARGFMASAKDKD